jgi:L-asparaginase
MAKSKILIIQTGGTIGMQRDEKGILRPADAQYLDKIPGLEQLADIRVERPFNVDSTDMETIHRKQVADLIFHEQHKYDGFVIAHGTDTMVDSAAAFNYMLQDLGKPIVLTGSQKPIFDAGSDAPNNLYNAVKVATMDIGEIVIAFGDKIIRGNRAIKESERSLNAFSSPRIQDLGEIGIDLILNQNRIRRFSKTPKKFTDFDTYVEFYQQTSGATTKLFEKYVESSDVHGIIIGGFGAGNIQSKLNPYIKRATEIGKPIVVVTRCQIGAADMGLYAVGADPLKAGAISVGDMTMEAATQKLMYTLGIVNGSKEGKNKIEAVKEIMLKPVNRDIIPK